MNKGKLVVLSGFSGAGKGTIVKQLIERYGYSLSVSATTRAPREGEVDGKDYYFKTTDEFLSLVDYIGLIEWTKYVDNYYGTPRKFVEDELKEGRTVIHLNIKIFKEDICMAAYGNKQHYYKCYKEERTFNMFIKFK